MGMASYFVSEDITIIDWDGLLEYCKRWKVAFPDGSIQPDEMIDKKEKMISFECWDSWKIISYWYDEILVFLRGIAKYLEGEVIFNFESDDESGWIEFKNKKCIIHTGIMQWTEWPPEINIRDKNKYYEFMIKEAI